MEESVEESVEEKRVDLHECNKIVLIGLNSFFIERETR